MILVIGKARARPEQRDDLISAARQIAAETRQDDGCLSYAFLTDLDDESVIVSLETWRDEESLNAHMTHPHTEQFLSVVPHLVEGAPSMEIHRIGDPR